MKGLTLRPGRAGDLRPAFDLGQGGSAEDLDDRWRRERPLIEFIDAQLDGHFLVCEDGDEMVGYTRVARFGSMDELSELWVAPSHERLGVGRALLEACWPESPNRELGRVALGAGPRSDLSLFTDFGLMPAGGHWHLRQRFEDYVERRSRELDSTEPAVHALTADRAVAEWKRLEPEAIGHERPLLHEFFGRTRTCLAIMDADEDRAVALCWVSPDGAIGPAVARDSESLAPVVLAALDRVARSKEPDVFGVFCTTDSWWLLDRLRRLGFRVHRPSWIMSSVPLPGLDRYLPSWPSRVL